MARLFLCDDDANYRALLRAVFAEGDDEIVGEGCDGQDCLDRVAASNPDVVLLDLNMPRVSGTDALPHLRVVMPAAKIIVLTSATPEDEEQRVRDLGADGFIQKPMDAFAIPHHLREALAAPA